MPCLISLEFFFFSTGVSFLQSSASGTIVITSANYLPSFSLHIVFKVVTIDWPISFNSFCLGWEEDGSICFWVLSISFKGRFSQFFNPTLSGMILQHSQFCILCITLLWCGVLSHFAEEKPLRYCNLSIGLFQLIFWSCFFWNSETDLRKYNVCKNACMINVFYPWV